jgi:lantibiotic biosynthesis protein
VTGTSGPWKPILEGDVRRQALNVVDEVAATLARLPLEDPSLMGGSAGRALLHARLAGHHPEHHEAAIACLRHAVQALGEPGGSGSLSRGAAGTGWVLTHLQGKLLDDRDRCRKVDRALLRLLDRESWPGHADLMHGLVGMGVYALERLDAPDGAALLDRVVGHLTDLATREGHNAYWWTPVQRLPAVTSRFTPDGRADLGVAHGVPGMVALLGAACTASMASDGTRYLLEQAVTWLLERVAGQDPIPNWWTPGDQRGPARTAWCYGEPGVAVALVIAAQGVNEPEWEAAAVRLARQAAARPVEETGVVDAGLCHGAAGLGLTFARLHRATGDLLLEDAARRWFECALDMRVPGQGVGGYAARGPDGLVADPGLLTGTAGVALALHAAATSHEPTWDRVLLASGAFSPRVNQITDSRGDTVDGGNQRPDASIAARPWTSPDTTAGEDGDE